jgi:hypothetical protein
MPLFAQSKSGMPQLGHKLSNFFDYDKQMGIEPEKCDNLLSWNRGDGATHGTLMRLKIIQATSGADHAVKVIFGDLGPKSDCLN